VTTTSYSTITTTSLSIVTVTNTLVETLTRTHTITETETLTQVVTETTTITKTFTSTIPITSTVTKTTTIPVTHTVFKTTTLNPLFYYGVLEQWYNLTIMPEYCWHSIWWLDEGDILHVRVASATESKLEILVMDDLSWVAWNYNDYDYVAIVLLNTTKGVDTHLVIPESSYYVLVVCNPNTFNVTINEILVERLRP